MGTKVKVKTDKPRRGPNKPSGRDRAELIAPGTNALMNRESVACVLQVSVRTFFEMVKAGTFPPADLHVGQNPRWTRDTVNLWIEDQSAQAKGGN
jgi:predicted DNA-binding transcriptional regulator AlpA